MKHIILNVLLLFIATATSLAVPARRGTYTYTQPDGSQIMVRLDGDEFFKSVTTEDGCAVTLGSDGYYYYLYYDFMGGRHNSGVRVGSVNSSQAASKSRSIPYELILPRSAARRQLMNEENARRKPMLGADTKAASTKKKAIIVLTQFSDLKFKYTRENFVDMLTKDGYSYGGATGSALEYFNAQFGGKIDFEFTVSPVVTLSKGYAYYGENDDDGYDKRAAEAVAEACRLASSQVDFSQFDGDNDGEVDNVFVFVAGEDEAEGASEDHIWSHQWYLKDGAGISLSLGGKRINNYCVSTEIMLDSSGKNKVFTSIGTFCHEYSHTLGLYDMYDTDYEKSGGRSKALWYYTSIMDCGNYNNGGNTPPNYNAIELEVLGLGTKLFLDLGEYTLPPISKEKIYCRANSGVDGEYYLLECRDNSGWDKYIGGSGMLIYHIDRASASTGYSDSQKKDLSAVQRWYFNEVNANPDHQCADLIEANPKTDRVSGIFWPYGSQTAFSGTTSPAYSYWNGKLSELSLIGITKTTDGVTFTVAGPLSIGKVEAFQDQAIVQWDMASGGDNGIGWISLTDPKGNTSQFSTKPYASGQYAYRFTGLSENTTYKVTIMSQKSGGEKVSTEFTTKSFYSDGYPFIYLNSAKRNNDGSFINGTKMPLVVYNARNAVSVKWTFNSKTVTDDGSQYYTIQGDGTLKAIVEYKDGTRDVISKRITVK